MPNNQLAFACTMTKMASGNVQVIICSASPDGLNSTGVLRTAIVIPSADFTSFNTTVNGGAAGATLTKSYAENASAVDYPANYTSGI